MKEGVTRDVYMSEKTNKCSKKIMEYQFLDQTVIMYSSWDDVFSKISKTTLEEYQYMTSEGQHVYVVDKVINITEKHTTITIVWSIICPEETEETKKGFQDLFGEIGTIFINYINATFGKFCLNSTLFNIELRIFYNLNNCIDWNMKHFDIEGFEKMTKTICDAIETTEKQNALILSIMKITNRFFENQNDILYENLRKMLTVYRLNFTNIHKRRCLEDASFKGKKTAFTLLEKLYKMLKSHLSVCDKNTILLLKAITDGVFCDANTNSYVFNQSVLYGAGFRTCVYDCFSQRHICTNETFYYQNSIFTKLMTSNLNAVYFVIPFDGKIRNETLSDIKIINCWKLSNKAICRNESTNTEVYEKIPDSKMLSVDDIEYLKLRTIMLSKVKHHTTKFSKEEKVVDAENVKHFIKNVHIFSNFGKSVRKMTNVQPVKHCELKVFESTANENVSGFNLHSCNITISITMHLSSWIFGRKGDSKLCQLVGLTITRRHLELEIVGNTAYIQRQCMRYEQTIREVFATRYMTLAVICMLLLRGGIEPNPGPGSASLGRDHGQTENYVWKLTDVLGRGATAVVYRARSKQTRDLCAVKVFHDRHSSASSGVPIRELETLRKLRHKNVIGIYCIEKELQSGNHVLAMELCTGGSLYAMLDQPKYAFGFQEEEFLVVVRDIAEGMKYIRQQDFIHRDIKPGNIMRFLDEDGSSVYKLTDFGAARQLDEEESFTSIYGTEEYLDPNMYRRAVLRESNEQAFGASVDLWSLGVTIYHVATGHLPFHPYGGRSNSAIMYKITSEKEHGVISGIQHEQNGEIVWSKELPKTCLLSQSLKSLITPVLAGIMESDIRIRWSFDQFFEAVNNILSMTKLNVFYSCQGCNLKLYIDGCSRFAALQEQIAMETDIPANEQLILYNNRDLSEVIDMTLDIKSYSQSILEGQLFLYNKERVDQQCLVMPEIIPFPSFDTYINYNTDASIAHRFCSVAFFFEKVIVLLIESQKLMQRSKILLRDHVTQITKRIDSCLPDMYRLLEETNKRQTTFYSGYEQVLLLYKVLGKTFTHPSELSQLCEDAEVKLNRILADRSPQDVIQKAENRAEEIKLYMSVLLEKIRDQEKEDISGCVGCLDNDKCIQKAKTMCLKMQEISSSFQKHRKQPSVTSEEHNNHSSDRDRLVELCVRMSSLLQSHCLMNYNNVYNVIIKQALLLVKNLQRTRKVDVNITSVMECQAKISARIDKLQEDCITLNTQYVDILQSQPIKTIDSGPIASDYVTMETMQGEPRTLALMSPNVSADPSYIQMVENISKEFKSLSSGSIELKELAEQNKSRLKESLDLAQGWLKEVEFNGVQTSIPPTPWSTRSRVF